MSWCCEAKSFGLDARGVSQALHDLGEPGLRGEVQRDVVQARVAALLRLAVGREPDVEAEVVVVAAGGDEQDVTGGAPARHVARLEDDVEAEEVDVERADAVDVCGPQLHVADSDVLFDGPLGALRRLKGALRAGHEPASTTRTAVPHGSAT